MHYILEVLYTKSVFMTLTEPIRSIYEIKNVKFESDGITADYLVLDGHKSNWYHNGLFNWSDIVSLRRKDG